MTKLSDLHTEWLCDPAYRIAYDALDDEYTLALRKALATGQDSGKSDY